MYATLALSVCVPWCVLVCVWLLVGQLERSAGFYVVVGGVGNNETVFRYEHRECVAKYAKRLSPHRHRHRHGSPWPDYYASLYGGYASY